MFRATGGAVKRAFVLSPEQVATFRDRGFLVLERISTDAEVARLGEIFDRLFAARAGWERGAQFDLAGTDEEGRPPALPQILNPPQFAPELEQTEFRAHALAIAKQLLGPEAHGWFEHAILKPAGYGAPTPWHQDEAHRYDPGVDYEQISIWMPLQEARLDNGCMQYIPGSHRGPILEHRSPGNDPRVSALECAGGFDPAQAVPCPLPAGGAVIHHCRTLHGSGPNRSELPRRAYILAFRGKATSAPERAPFPWLAEKHTAAQQRQAAWRQTHPAPPRARPSLLQRVIGRMRRLAARG